MKINISQTEANKIGAEIKCEVSIWEKEGHRRAYIKSKGIQRGWIDLETSKIHTSGDRWNDVPAVLEAMKNASVEEKEVKNTNFSMYSGGSNSDVIILEDGTQLIMD